MVESAGAEERPDTDPDSDAPWRPGYAGWRPDDADHHDHLDDHDHQDHQDRTANEPSVTSAVAGHATSEPDRDGVADGHPDGTTAESTRGRRRPIGVVGVVGVVVVVVVFALVGVAGWRWWTDDDLAAVDDRAPTIARSGEDAWSATVVDGPPIMAAGDGVLVLASPFDEQVRAHDLDTGNGLWSASALVEETGVSEVVVLGDRVVVEQRLVGGDGVLTAFDRRTGAVEWTSEVAGPGARILPGPPADALIRRHPGAGQRGLDLLDPADGTVAGTAVSLSNVTTPDASIVVAPSDGRVALWSPSDHRFVTAPVSDFDLLDIAAVDGGTVGFGVGERIVAFDDAGKRTDELLFRSDASGRSARRSALAGAVHDEHFAIVASGSSVGIRVDSGSIEVVWQLEGRAGAPVPTERGVVSVVLGATTDAIVDALSGDVVVDLGPSTPGARGVRLGHDAYITDTLTGADGRMLEAFDYDGVPRWSRRIAPAATVEVVDGAVVILGDRDGAVILR